MKSSKIKLFTLIIFAVIFSACALAARPTSAQTNSNDASKLVTVKQETIDQCGKALEELSVYDKLLESKEAEIRLLKERLQLEKEKLELLRELADTRRREADSNREANEALRAALNAKEQVIANKDREIEILKKKNPSLVKTIQQIAIGLGIGFLLK